MGECTIIIDLVFYVYVSCAAALRMRVVGFGLARCGLGWEGVSFYVQMFGMLDQRRQTV